MNNQKLRNWAELPPDLTLEILSRVGAVDILVKAQKVCKSWYHVCKDPYMWRKIDMYNLKIFRDKEYSGMCRHAVDRSQGGLVEIDIWQFGDDKLLNYVADRSKNLKILRLIMSTRITPEGFREALVKLPLLEYLELSDFLLPGKSLRVAGQSCPNLRTLKIIFKYDIFFDIRNHDAFNNNNAFAIAQSMPQLRHLELFGNFLNNEGLNAILDGCPHLEHLDLRKCFNLDFTGDLEKRCIERIKDLKRPNDYYSNAGPRFMEFL